jgi:predicted small secreted protein
MEQTAMKKLIALSLIAWFVALAGCNTMQGLGKDLERAGEKIQKKAER